MFRVSNNLIGILNLVTFLLSVPVLGTGIWLSTRASTDCEKFLDTPLIVLGAFLLLVSLAGLVGACCRVSWLLWAYLLVMFLLIVALFCFTVFAFVVTNKGAGEVVSGRGYKEYRLGDYSNWLRRRVENPGNWRRIKSCLQDGKVCRSLADSNIPQADFFNRNLSPIQSGCCKPPSSCQFTYMNPTVWNKPDVVGANSTDPDCNTWNNDQNVLCYDCQSCKAGVLANLKNDWKRVAVINIIFLIFLIVVYSIGCCAFRNNREDNAFPTWKRYP